MSIPTLPNPGTPLALLPPDIGDQYLASRYLYMATLGAFTWDVLMNLPKDISLLTKHKFSLPTATYFISRISAMVFILSSTIFQVAEVEHCQALVYVIGVTASISFASTGALMYFRVIAVLSGQRTWVLLFTMLWFVDAGTSILVPIGLFGTHIPTTKFCINTAVKPIVTAALLVGSIHDTLIFLAITWKLAITQGGNGKDRAWFTLRGRNLPQLSKVLLQSGQKYYLATFGSSIIVITLILTPSVPPIIRAMWGIPNLALMNAMACQVYRQVKFGVISTNPSIHATSTNNATPSSHKFAQVSKAGKSRPAGNDADTFVLSDIGSTTIGTVHIRQEQVIYTDPDTPAYHPYATKKYAANQV